MKQTVYRLLWINDERLKRTSKIFSLVYVILGLLMMGVALAFYIVLEPKMEYIIEGLNDVSSRINVESASNTIASLDIKAASGMLLVCSKLAEKFVAPITVLIFVIGFLVLSHGIMYFRIHEIINEDT